MNAHNQPTAIERIAQYLSLQGGGAKIKKLLGEGTDGEVWATDQDSAVKAFIYDSGYANERDAYARLAEYGVTEKIAGFWIPKMLGHNNELMVIEMDIVQNPPYIIDFAKSRLNIGPDFPEQTLIDNEAKGKWLFENNWPAVKVLMAHLESFLIFYLDPQPHNIVFPKAPDDDDSANHL